MTTSAADSAPGVQPALGSSAVAPVRTLVLVRHAKAESSSPDGDHARTLTPRGAADATAVGTWLAQAGLHPDLVVCSTAARARQTWAAAVEGGASAARVDEDRRVYDASREELLDVVREAPEDAAVVVLVGHAPGVPELATALADPATSDADVLQEIRSRFPTSALVRLEYAGLWAELTDGSAALVELAVPRA